MPVEYAKMLEYIRRAPTDEHIDYRYLEKLLYQVAENNHFNIDWKFDWMFNSELGGHLPPPEHPVTPKKIV
jgi:hypothetical protein